MVEAQSTRPRGTAPMSNSPPAPETVPDTFRVLIVDDEEAHAQAVAESLERTGFQCAIATSGRDGVRRIESEDFDLIITDLVMDDTDGFGILQKAKEELPDAEVVLISGQGTIKQAVTAMQQG